MDLDPMSTSTGLIASLAATGKPWVLGHRGMGKNGTGTGSDWGENTMLSFKAALDAGVPAVECDVRATKDGAVIVLHDETLERTAETGALPHLLTTPVSKLTLAEIRSVPVGGGMPPPLFQEVLDLTLRMGRGLFVELKDSNCAAEVSRLMRVRDGSARAVNVISFEAEWLACARDVLPRETDVGLLLKTPLAGLEEVVLSIGASNVGVRHTAVDAAVAEEIKNTGVALWLWNPLGSQQIASAIRLGVAGMGSDDPTSSLKYVEAAAWQLDPDQHRDWSYGIDASGVGDTIPN